MLVIRRCSTPNRPTRQPRSASCRLRPTASPTPPPCSRRWAAAGGAARIWRGPTMTSDSRRIALVLAVAGLLPLIGCSGRDHEAEARPAAHGVTLTAAQRRHIGLVTVQPSTFRASVQTYG